MERRIIMAVLFFMILSVRVNATTLSAYKKIPFGQFKLTAFCPCCDCSEGYQYKTATQTIAKQGRTIAVDPEVISFGSQVLIGDTVYIAEDCGGAVKGDTIDIFFDNHNDVEEFGVKHCDVYIIRGEWEQ